MTASPQKGPHIQNPATTVTESGGKALNILVVEDHSDTLNSLLKLTRSLGHRVFSARGAAGARALLRDSAIDVLICDIGLPDGTGWSLLEQTPVRPERPLYAIAVSGYSTGADCARSRAAGFRRHLIKPFIPAALIDALEEAQRELPGSNSAAAAEAEAL